MGDNFWIWRKKYRVGYGTKFLNSKKGEKNLIWEKIFKFEKTYKKFDIGENFWNL